MSDSKNIDERCVLCLDPKRFPVSVKCGHSFCFGCLDIYKSYSKYPWANKCPICREAIEEPKRPMKRKHSDQSSNAQSGPISTSYASLTSTTMQRNSSFEDFMSLAANYLDDSRDEGDIYFDSYEYNSVNNAQDLTLSDENFATPYSEGAEDNSYEEEPNFSTDSEDYNVDTFDVDDDHHDGDDDDGYRYYDEDDEFAYEHHSSTDAYYDNDYNYYSEDHDHDDDAEGISSNFNVDDDDDDNDNEPYAVDRFDVDWETVIASDVIIID